MHRRGDSGFTPTKLLGSVGSTDNRSPTYRVLNHLDWMGYRASRHADYVADTKLWVEQPEHHGQPHGSILSWIPRSARPAPWGRHRCSSFMDFMRSGRRDRGPAWTSAATKQGDGSAHARQDRQVAISTSSGPSSHTDGVGLPHKPRCWAPLLAEDGGCWWAIASTALACLSPTTASAVPSRERAPG